MKIKIYLLIVLAAVTAAWLISPKSTAAVRKSIMVTNFSLYDATRFIAPEEVVVEMLLPFGKDAHAYEPTPQEIVRLMQSRHFFYVGNGLDAWVGKMTALDDLKHKTDLSGVITWQHGACGHAHEEHDHDLDHEVHAVDPHYWLSIENQKAVAVAVAEEFKKLYAVQSKRIDEKLGAYLEALDALDAVYRKRLESCRTQTIFVTHDAFGYLSGMYGFKVASLLGMAPESQAQPQEMQKHIREIARSGAKVLFYESFISDVLAQTIARQTGAQVDMLHTLATVQDANQTYETLMRANLDKLAKAMVCP